MSTEFDLPWILPYVRESLRGRGNFSFDGFADGIFALLEKVGAGKGIEKRPIGTGYTGYTYNFDAAHHDIRFAVTEQNRFIPRPPPTNAPAFVSGGQCQVTQRGQDWANNVDPLPEDYNGYMKQFGATTDDVVREYISEALHTFIHGTYFASAVMIGAASEKAIYLLADSLVPALIDRNLPRNSSLAVPFGVALRTSRKQSAAGHASPSSSNSRMRSKRTGSAWGSWHSRTSRSFKRATGSL